MYEFEFSLLFKIEIWYLFYRKATINWVRAKKLLNPNSILIMRKKRENSNWPKPHLKVTFAIQRLKIFEIFANYVTWIFARNYLSSLKFKYGFHTSLFEFSRTKNLQCNTYTNMGFKQYLFEFSRVIICLVQNTIFRFSRVIKALNNFYFFVNVASIEFSRHC